MWWLKGGGGWSEGVTSERLLDTLSPVRDFNFSYNLFDIFPNYWFEKVLNIGITLKATFILPYTLIHSEYM